MNFEESSQNTGLLLSCFTLFSSLGNRATRCEVPSLLQVVFITARKRSLGQGNIFTPVCHSVHRGGSGVRGCSGGCAWLLWGGVCGCSGGMHGCSQGVGHVWLLRGRWLLQGGMLQGGVLAAPGGVHAWLLGGASVVAPGGTWVGYDNTRRYGQWAGGTHPTGMHSCLCNRLRYS